MALGGLMALVPSRRADVTLPAAPPAVRSDLAAEPTR
jgi:hypothetical protein